MRKKVKDEHLEAIKDVLDRSQDVFSRHKADLGGCNFVGHEIELQGVHQGLCGQTISNAIIQKGKIQKGVKEKRPGKRQLQDFGPVLQVEKGITLLHS